MSFAQTSPLLPGATPIQTRAILGAMRAIAETNGPATSNGRLAVAAASHYLFGHVPPLAFEAITPVTPSKLVRVLTGGDLAKEGVKFLTIMAFVDGSLDKAKIASVLQYANALGIHEHYLQDIREAAQGRLQEVLADMTRCNMESITGHPWEGRRCQQVAAAL